MKQIISLLLSLFLIVAFSGCHNSVKTGDMPPMIDMYGQKYVAPNMPVNRHIRSNIFLTIHIYHWWHVSRFYTIMTT